MQAFRLNGQQAADAATAAVAVVGVILQFSINKQWEMRANTGKKKSKYAKNAKYLFILNHMLVGNA